ncbi:MAG: hypothetical protein KAW12_16560 [Candidatus Aminicenantes bacterium]|nr:hypothetical protein [Candidatus Aminicenantes bacterium]
MGEVFIQEIRIKGRGFDSFFVGESFQKFVSGFLLKKFRGQHRTGEWVGIPIEEWDMKWAAEVFSSPVELELIGTGGIKLAASELPLLDIRSQL